MVRFRGGQSSTIALIVLFPALMSIATAQDLYDRPVLAIDPGMHTSVIWEPAVDTAGHFIVTGSYDKTVRVWSPTSGKSLHTTRVPAGPGNIGRIYAVAMSPDGSVFAAGGLTGELGTNLIYLFDPNTGNMTGRVPGVSPNDVHHLSFSADGRYLAASLGTGGLRVFDREKNWSETFRDTNYTDSGYGASFAPDGRLATASFDGKIRLYDGSFKLLVSPHEAPSGHHPRRIAFSPDGKVLALGYMDTPAVDLLDGFSLDLLPGPDNSDLHNGNLGDVAWSQDGQMLYAAGSYVDLNGSAPVLAWGQSGAGARRTLSTSACGATMQPVTGIASMPAGQLLIAKGDPCLLLLGADGAVKWAERRPGADIRNQQRSFAVSEHGSIIDFNLDPEGTLPIRFDLGAKKLLSYRADGVTRPPKQTGLSITDWDGSFQPSLNGTRIELKPWEVAHSLAIHPDGKRFVIGTSWWLRALDAEGKGLWKHEVPQEVFAVNITGDGRLVVTANNDGTIRWYRMDDGHELLALYVLAGGKDWVAWTPEGFYGATPGAYGVLRWHVNRRADTPADAVPVYLIPRQNRPDVLPFVLTEQETLRALGRADMVQVTRDILETTGAQKPPGSRLHVLTIGISDYGDRATRLRLKFAHKDAEDLANALVNTQGGEHNKLGGLYVDVVPQYLSNDKANRSGIFSAFDSMQRHIAGSAEGQDLAVIMFSGHGAIIDSRFYLLPHGVDASTPTQIKATAISAEDFQAEVKKVAEHGRVLLLLDTCHSAAVSTDRSILVNNADLLRSLMASSNVTVLTSSKGEEFSRENETWKNGAFTKVLVDALGSEADENHDGLISTSELIAYLSRRLPQLTEERQHPGLELRFETNLFIAGL